MPQHSVVSQQEWLTARKALLLKEKEATHLRDRIMFSTARKGRSRWPSSSTAAASSSFITS